MPSGNGARIHLSLLLTALMLMPTMLALASFSHEQEEMGTESSPLRSSDKNLGAYLGQLGVPQTNDVSHGWNVEGNIGEAALYHRTAAYVPIQDWTAKTGERIVSGWHTLGHDYPIPSDWKSELSDLGIDCQTFFAPQGFHCNVPELPPETLMEHGVIGIFRLDPTDKLAPDILPIMKFGLDSSAIKEGDSFILRVLIAGPGLDHISLEKEVEVRDFFSERFVTIVANQDEVNWLVNQNYVEWVEPVYPDELMNGEATEIMNVNWVRDGTNMGGALNGLTGDGVIIGVMDSGLDVAGACTSLSSCNSVNSGTIHPAFAGRLAYADSFWGSPARESWTECQAGDDGPNDQHGHGTHVAGSVLGDGSNSEEGYDGTGSAPGAQLYMQSVACWHYTSQKGWKYYMFTPDDYQNDIFQPAYDAGARVHTNSWGSAPSGNEYTLDSLLIDQSAYAMDDLLILYAMGNDGEDANLNGEIDLALLNPQATAKNILSIGASENFRCDIYYYTWSDVGYGAAPIKDDLLACETEGIAALSNRGPTEDGRIKPDLVAPGTFIASTRSTDTDEDGDPVEYTWGYPGGSSDYYAYNTGTSMATPLTAGAAALVIEFLNDRDDYDCTSPTYDCPASALLKAMMSAGAHDMDGQYQTGGDGKNSAIDAAPNNHEGWGRVDIQGAVGSSFTDGIDITTSESHSLKLEVTPGTSEFRVVLSWNDPPNSPSALYQLVNDLDITLKDPSGDYFDYTNDDVNNLVGITVENPDAGDWEIIITGVSVPEPNPGCECQTYYVAASGGLAITDMRHPVSDGLFSGELLHHAGFQSGSIFTETTIATGDEHICTIFHDSSLQCWGDNSHGQLGDGTTTDRQTMTPVGLEAGRTAVSVSAGASHTCATLDDSSLKCWGKNNQGQLGDGTTASSASPVSVGLGGFPVQVSAGLKHTCAVLTDASLECWGDNSHGQLGDGTTTDSSSPVAVSFSGGQKVLAVSAGGSHTCAVLNDRSLKCWGENGDGQLGIGSSVDSSSPADVNLGDYVVAVSTGESHTCGLRVDQDLKCWGGNDQGQLGTGDQVSQDSPPSSPILSGIISIDSGSKHNCAIDTAQALHCWGGNSDGQVGDGTTSTVTSPSTIGMDTNPVLGTIAVVVGDSYSCATASDDLLRCWGGADAGTITIGLAPSQFELPRWTYINSAERDLDNDGSLNLFDTHGAGDSDGDGFPAGPNDIDDGNPAIAKDCNAGSYGRYICKQATVGFYVGSQGSLVMTPARAGHYVDSDGAQADSPCGIGTYQELTGQTSCDPARAGYYVDGIGASSDTPCPGGTFNPDTGSISSGDCDGSEPGYNVPILTQISSGSYHTCAVLDDGSVSCWGDNANGQLGDGTRVGHTVPDSVLLPLGKSAVSISAGSYHTCAVLDDGSLRCWGSNEFGQLGDGTSIERTSPVSVDLGPGRTAVSVSVGESHTCAVLDDSGVKCWGENSNGQIGDGTSTNRFSPVSVDLGGGDTAVSVSSGSYHTCAITDDRSVKCWGDNWHGQLGDGSTGDRISPTSVELPGNSSAVTLSSGSFHTCVGLNDGSMFCWGYNAYGQLGNSATTNSNAPSAVGLTEFESPIQVSTGMYHSCALFDSGSVSCWGGNSEGQLGDGGQTDTSIPDTVNLPVGKNALSISVGQRHSCAILDDATLYCWGYNAYGQLGDGTTANQISPANIDLRHGSGAQIPCSIGTFQPNASQTSCILADRGYSVPLPASLNQTGCTKGHYSNLRGQASCNQASIGYYVDEHLADSQTACPPFNSTVQLGSINFDLCKPDFDGDMTPDVTDLDDDDDGVEDRYDFDPLDPEVSIDSDGDGIPDSLDIDDDNDGVNDTIDLFPYNQGEWEDEDNDGVGDNSDSDDDNDGRDDMFDVFPNDPEEWSDFDGDGIGDNADEDDDNDGVNDVDNNPYVDLDDAFPLDSTEWLDSDGDSIGNNQDDDDDGDGYDDGNDSFPLNPSEWLDSDGDTFGDNFDWDDNDPNEWVDSDGDQVGDNSDQCPDEEGLNDSFENFAHKLALGNKLGCPLLEGEIVEEEGEGEEVVLTLADVDVLDTDGDGVVDLFDPDDDNDGIPDAKDGKVNSISGDGEFSKDPTRPFGENTWLVISLSLIFLSIMGYRILKWQSRQAAKLKSKRIRLG